ncbi:alcohol dehydrogenase [Xylariomycetidae sp. FL0641]|nr:alcohol dehydrogenase [Xylariomycetidae sp. FL0641]
MPAAAGEEFYAWEPPKPRPFVSHGLPFADACAHHARHTFKATRVYVVVSRSISQTPAFAALQAALGERLAGVRRGIRPHTPWEDVFALAADLRAADPDLIVTLGAGSVTDGVKLARLAAANGLDGFAALDALFDENGQPVPGGILKPAFIPVVNVPTTLSGGEFTAAAGATDLASGHKRVVRHDSLMADLVVFDPRLTVSTPARFWTSTGIRAVDHCAEGLYADGLGELRGVLARALRRLLVSLLRTQQNWEDAEARLASMLGVRDAIRGVARRMGASHGIGHQLGPLGVGHGETSCVVLPQVLRYNWARGDAGVKAKLRPVVDAFYDEPEVAAALGLQERDRDAADPGDLLAAYVRKLGLPGSLGEFGIGRDQFNGLAENAMRDWCTANNIVPVDKEKVVEILEMAA